MIARLVLEDGTEFIGQAVGYKANVSGEVVFTTGMTGYQEVLTDPSYCNQIVTFTYPLIGNQGINKHDFESKRPNLTGIITKEICDHPSNWQSEISLSEYLQNCKVTALTGVDTRKLTKIIREQGSMTGEIICEHSNTHSTQDNEYRTSNENKTKLSSQVTRKVEQVTTDKSYVLPGANSRIVLLDLGVKQSLVNSLNNLGATVIVLPAFTSAEEILSYEPHGIVLSNGPGDPQDVIEISNTIEKLLEQEIPVLGVCLGHQLLGLSLGYKSKKMRFGHRGVNHPVKDVRDNKVRITSQNHGYVLSDETVPNNTFITHINLNDHTVEGIQHNELPVFSVQFHPEAGPGPEESGLVLEKFMKSVREFQDNQIQVNKEAKLNG